MIMLEIFSTLKHSKNNGFMKFELLLLLLFIFETNPTGIQCTALFIVDFNAG
jgi:hypothetical protein